jgi:acetyl-CoA carboxylase biotin carboxyl carrier protein
LDSKDLRELMEYVAKSDFVEFVLEQEGFKLKLVKEGAEKAAAPAPQGYPVGMYPMQAPPQLQAPPPSAAPAAGAGQVSDDEGIYQVTAPMVGTFYRAPNPNAPAYVEVGSVVKKGQVICIVEAMKLMNEIEAEVSGEVLEIPVANAQPVEYGEVIFRIRRTS